jgi:hypothetical protein
MDDEARAPLGVSRGALYASGSSDGQVSRTPTYVKASGEPGPRLRPVPSRAPERPEP